MRRAVLQRDTRFLRSFIFLYFALSTIHFFSFMVFSFQFGAGHVAFYLWPSAESRNRLSFVLSFSFSMVIRQPHAGGRVVKRLFLPLNIRQSLLYN